MGRLRLARLLPVPQVALASAWVSVLRWLLVLRLLLVLLRLRLPWLRLLAACRLALRVLSLRVELQSVVWVLG